MKKLIIFGLSQIAEVAYFYFTHDSEYEVVAFCVDKEYRTQDFFMNLPVLDFETIEKYYSSEECDLFISMGYSKINQLRSSKYQEAKNKGYTLAKYISSKATILINQDTDIGENTFILEDNTIQPYTKIGNNVVMWSGNHLGHHSVIEDHCFIASHVVISGGVTIGHHSFLGVNATLRDHISIGAYNVIGAGCLILKNTEDYAVYIGQESEKAKVPSNRLRGI